MTRLVVSIFSDNELSPECLDGVQHLLKPTGISIPYNSKSFIQPIMSKGIYSQIQKRTHENGTPAPAAREKYSEPTEVSWLIYMSRIFHIDQPKELFTFVHPNKDDPIDNTRYARIQFKACTDSVLHGFAGYFTSELYKDVEISILPTTHTEGICI